MVELEYTYRDFWSMTEDVRGMAKSWSSELACYNALGKAVAQKAKLESDADAGEWLRILSFMRISELPGTVGLRLSLFGEYGPSELVHDRRMVFAQCCCTYEEFRVWMAEQAREAEARKKVRQANMETNRVLMNLENDYPSIDKFVTALRDAIDNKACINYGSAKITVYRWAPGTCRRYRTGPKLYTLDSRKTPLTAETLKTMADAVLESCGEGW